MTARQRKMLRRRRRMLRRVRKQVLLLVRAANVRVDGVARLANRALTLAGRGVDKLFGLAERLLDHLDDNAPAAKGRPRRARRPQPPSSPSPPPSPQPQPSSPRPAETIHAPKRRASKPRARCVVVVEKKTKKKSAGAHGRGKRLAAGVDGIRRINVTRELVTGRVDHERAATFLRNLLVELVFPDVLTRGRRLQELLGELLREVIAGARRTAVWIWEKSVSMVVAAAAWASRLLADLHHRLPSLVPLTNKRKPARARGNRPRPSSGPSP
jgi:hypothetical protein